MYCISDVMLPFSKCVDFKLRQGVTPLSPFLPINKSCFPLNGKVCELPSIRWKTAFTFTPAGGQIASGFIMSWHSPWLSPLWVLEKNACVLQLIICTKCRTCLSFVLLLFQFVCVFICSITFLYFSSSCSKRAHCLLDKNRLYLFGEQVWKWRQDEKI